MLLFLLIPLLTQALVIHETNCVGDFCEGNLKSYVRLLNPIFRSGKEDDKYIAMITHRQPGMPMASLYMNVYTIGLRKIKVDDLTKESIGSNFVIRIDLTEEDIENPSKCSKVDTDDMHISYECIFCIEYTSQIQSGPMRIFIYSMIVKIPRTQDYDYFVHDSQIYDERCGCGLIKDLEYNVKLYKGASCVDEIATGATVIRGEDICIGVFGNDDTTKCYYFVFTTLETTYTSDSLEPTPTDMLKTAITKRRLDGTDKKGQLYAIIPTDHIGRLEIKMVITLTETLNSEFVIEEGPWPKGIFTDLSESLEVISFDEPLPPPPPPTCELNGDYPWLEGSTCVDECNEHKWIYEAGKECFDSANDCPGDTIGKQKDGKNYCVISSETGGEEPAFGGYLFSGVAIVLTLVTLI